MAFLMIIFKKRMGFRFCFQILIYGISAIKYIIICKIGVIRKFFFIFFGGFAYCRIYFFFFSS